MSNGGVIPFNAWNIKEIGQDGALKQLSKSELLHRLAGLNTFSDADSDGGSSSELEQVEQSEQLEQVDHACMLGDKRHAASVAHTHAVDPRQSQSYAQACSCPAAVTTHLVPPVPCETLSPSMRGPGSNLSPSLHYANSQVNNESRGISRHGNCTAQPARERLPSVGSVPSELSDEDDFDICDNDVSAGDDGDDSLHGMEPPDTSSCVSSATSSVVSSPTMAASGLEPGSATADTGFDLGASWCVAAARAPARHARTRSGDAINDQTEAQLHCPADMDWDVVGV